MKIFLFLIAVFVLLWLLRGSIARRPGNGAAKRRPATPQRCGSPRRSSRPR